MMASGLRFAPVADPQDCPAQDRIGFTVSGGDENIMERVLRGRVDDGAMSQAVSKNTPRTDRTELRIIGQTYSIPRHVVSIAPIPARSRQPAKIRRTVVAPRDRNGNRQGTPPADACLKLIICETGAPFADLAAAGTHIGLHSV